MSRTNRARARTACAVLGTVFFRQIFRGLGNFSDSHCPALQLFVDMKGPKWRSWYGLIVRKMPNNLEKLSKRIAGDVHTDEIRRYLLSTDGSIFRKQPACVVYPKHTQDVVTVLSFAAKNNFSIHPRGAGSGLCGSALGSGIVIDFTKYMNRLVHIDYKQKTFECQPGYRGGELEALLEGRELFFPPMPSSGEYATFGGMVATNASGSQSVKYGNVSDYIADAQIVLSDGHLLRLSEVAHSQYARLPEKLQNLYRLYRDNTNKIETGYPNVNNNVSGYNLRGLVLKDRLWLHKLFAGAEGTLGIVTRLKFRLLDKPAHNSLIVAYFDDIVSSARAVQQILPLGPSGIEIMDKSLLNLAREKDASLRDKIPGNVDNVLLIEFDSARGEKCAAQAEQASALMKANNLTDRIFPAVSAAEKKKLWAVRKAAVPILFKLKRRKKILALVEDAAVPTDKLVDYFEGIYTIMKRRKVDFVLYGHIAKGLIHIRPLLDLKDPHDIKLLKPLADEMFELVLRLDGAVSGEHGDGRLRSVYIQRQYPEVFGLFKKTKRLLDPFNLLNPEIKTVCDPEQMHSDLRFGGQYTAFDLDTHLLRWPEHFTDEIEKCHGCAKCTTITTATRMCPVYKFTLDESAAPKAKANILRGLISGGIADKALYEKAFQQVIKRCANCGSCHKECPSNVNIPKLAMEARAQYARRFGSPIEDRIFTGVEFAGKALGKHFKVLQPFSDVYLVRTVGERLTGFSSQRDIIAFSHPSLFEKKQKTIGHGSPAVLYFAGCYSGYIRPEIGRAAVRVLKSMNMRIHLPDQHCCGLPMLSKGMTNAAKNKIRTNLAKWRHLLDAVDYIVVTCSSCGVALMQDWGYLVEDPAVQAVSWKVIHISRLINKFSGRLRLQALNKAISYHMPCHLKIQENPNSSLELLMRIPGLRVNNLDSHCCGMIGSWGLSAENFDLSKRIGLEMITKLNNVDSDFGVTDCPTCRMQMEQFGTKQIRHPVQVVAAGIAHGA